MLRRLGRFLLRFAAVALLLVAAAYLLREPLLARPVARWVAARLSESLGGEYSLERVEGDWYREVVL
ncbi:MAG: hypothetical protein ACREID_03965, partial [Planctomycetota bacterium]